LPASRPIQLWFGEFIHGVLEEAYRRYKDSVKQGQPTLPPWTNEEIEDIRKLIKARLAARGLYAWAEDVEELGDRRAWAVIQELGPYLFPIIRRAEVRLYGARKLPEIEKTLQFREADRYEMVGIVDVITHIELADPAFSENPIVQLLTKSFSTPPTSKFEVIIDYKGMRRSPALLQVKDSLWEQYAWQVQTYAELRRKQADALPVKAGVLLYVNEFFPTPSDFEALKFEIQKGTTDVPPAGGSAAEKILNDWAPGKPIPQLPFEYRLARALRVVPVTEPAVEKALAAFDGIVKRIETCRGRELVGTRLIEAWERNSDDESTCVVCDSRTYCPDYQQKYARKRRETRPRLPGIRKREF
jgi:hypothetical protein